MSDLTLIRSLTGDCLAGHTDLEEAVHMFGADQLSAQGFLERMEALKLQARSVAIEKLTEYEHAKQEQDEHEKFLGAS